MPRVPRIAVLSAKDMAVHAQTQANAGAPRHISAMVQGLAVDLQRTPAALGFQRTNAIVFNPHFAEGSAQWRFEHGTVPGVGQPACGPGQAATDVGGRKLHATIPQDKWPTGRDADGRDISDV